MMQSEVLEVDFGSTSLTYILLPSCYFYDANNNNFKIIEGIMATPLL